MDASVYVVVGFEIAVGVSFELLVKHFRVGLMADAEEESAGREVPDFAGLYIAQLKTRDFIFGVVIDIFYHCVGSPGTELEFAL